MSWFELRTYHEVRKAIEVARRSELDPKEIETILDSLINRSIVPRLMVIEKHVGIPVY